MAGVRAGEAIAEGFRFMGPAVSQSFGAIILQAGVVVITELMGGDQPAPYMTWLVVLLRLPFTVIMTGAFLRLALAGDVAVGSGSLGPGGLQWGSLEWRLLGLRLILGVIYVMIAIAAILMIVIGIVALMGTGLIPQIRPEQINKDTILGLLAGPLGLALLVLGIPALALFIFIGVKLSLAYLVTAAEGKLGIGRAWGLSSGVFWPLLAVALVGGLVSLGAGAVGGIIGGVAKALLGGSATRLGAAFGAGLGAAFGELFLAGAFTFIYRTVTGAGGAVKIDEVFV
jgi:hypothetical protein